jgi:hypothetical protein
MRKISLLLIIAVMCFTSCNKYLDVVPVNITKVEDLFATKTDATDALAKIYWYLPVIDNIHETPFLLGDEYVITRTDLEAIDNGTGLVGQQIMRDRQSSGNPLMGLWSGTGRARHLYVGMRHCDLFMQNVDLVYDMSEQEKDDMKAQVTFLKAYYAFQLIQHYGPIVIPQYLETDETDPEKLFPQRVSIDSSFNYVIKTMRDVIPKLRTKVGIVDYGQVDQTVAKSILARVLIFRASPFFNGNNDLMSSFRNHDGTHLFPQVYDKEKWKDAIDALDDAIETCNGAGIRLYEYARPTFYNYDSVFVRSNPTKARKFYSRRFIIAEPWNTELIWGRSDLYLNKGDNSNSNDILSNACNIMLPDRSDYQGAGYSEPNNPAGAAQFMSASYQMLERYYTENGLPIDEDRLYAVDEKYRLAAVPDSLSVEYTKYEGLMQPGDTVIKLLLNRELRFYSDLIITGGYARTHRYRIRTSMYMNTDGGRKGTHPENYFGTGIGIQKMVHPESGAGWSFAQIRFPLPYIRLADLYLMRAEAVNEYYEPGDAERAQAYEDVNLIRTRAGIPTLQDSWAQNRAKTPNKHSTQAGMREIILQERAIEFAFEGIHYWDVVRHKMATTEFSRPITGWNITGTSQEDFFLLRTIQTRRFPRSSYLWPLTVTEMNINGNLVNNPGW